MLHRCTLIVVLALSLAIAGCEKSKVTADNYAKIKVGMSLSEVTSILGSKYEDQTPSAGYNAGATGISATAATENIYVFTSNDTKILVTMKNGKVVDKSNPSN